MRRMKCAIGIAVVILSVPCLATAQQPVSAPKVGVLYSESPQANPTRSAAFHSRLRDLGYVEGKTITVHDRSAEGRLERLPDLARELVALKVDVIVATAVAASVAARQATSSIPIVMVNAGNPIGAGLIKSLARPGGNVTGTTSMLEELGSKQLELLRQVVPRASRVAILLNPTNAGARPTLQDATAAAVGLGFELISIEVSRSEDFEPAFAGILQAKADALFIVVEPLILMNRKRIIDFAAQARLPAVYSLSWPVRDGGLLSYGINLDVNFGSAAVYVDKILKGANPAELPVEQPTLFELVVNLKTAQALGLTIPPEILASADEVIE